MVLLLQVASSLTRDVGASTLMRWVSGETRYS
jgi:hypothetical protein